MAYYNPEWWSRIVEYELLDVLAVSYYATDRELYSKMQPPLNFDDVEKNIKKLVKLKQRFNMDKPEINLHIMVIPENYSKINAFAEKWRSILGDSHVGLVHWDSWTGRKPYSEQFESLMWGKPEETSIRPKIA